MKKAALLLLTFLAMLSFGCMTTGGPKDGKDAGDTGAKTVETGAGEASGAADSEPDTNKEPAWSITVKGMHEQEIDAAYVAEAKQHDSHYVERKLERKGETRTYRGIPLWMVIAMVDGPDKKHPYVFDEEQWQEGYEITITAADGYSVTFVSKDYEPDAIIIADSIDGEEVLPRIAGDAPGNLLVRKIDTIEAALGEGEEEEVFTLKIEVDEAQKKFTIEELEASPYYVEGMGSYTTSAGTTYTHRYGGVKFAAILNSFVDLEPSSTIVIVASDGYEMTYQASQFMDTEEGTWILAFKRDGEYLPFDPGYIRTVKVGPDTPNIEGHLSVKMIETIRISGETFEDFTLEMRGKMDMDLDRQTVQSGVSCHEKKVTFLDKKSGEEIVYTGIPLWLILAYADDPDYAPHKQKDQSILSYDADAAEEGYTVKIRAEDGFSVSLDSGQIHKNEDIILAMYREGKSLPADERPLVLVWDKDAAALPAGIKSVRTIARIELLFE